MKLRERTDYVVIHCAQTKPSMDIGFKEIDQWHKRRGWAGCGYNFIIRQNGIIETGRALEQVGAHVKGFNHNSLGICLVGGIDEDGDFDVNYTPEQWDTLDCPIFEVAAWLKQTKEIRTS